MRLLLLVLLLSIGLAACARVVPTATPPPTPTATPALPPVTLPGDEAPHGHGVEWWYWNVQFSSDASPRYALHYVVFRVRDPNSGRTLHVAQVGLGDTATGTFTSAERLATLREIDEPRFGFEVTAGDWLLASTSEGYRLRGEAGSTRFDLLLRDAGRPMLHDGDGIVDFGEAGQSAYYTRPRLETEGTVAAGGGEASPVRGLGWLDKQWGDFSPVAVHWDWASVQLRDGRSLMLTRLETADGRPVQTYGSFMQSPDGETRHLTASDFHFAPQADSPTWQSPATGALYATEWEVAYPAEGIWLVLRPLVQASEFRSGTLGVTYWEAGMTAHDLRGGAPSAEPIGQGFVELTGRAPSPFTGR